MRALSLDAPGKIQMVSLSDPSMPGPTEALIRIRQVGICGTDYHAFHGNQPFFTYPRILGHELGVEIVAIGADVRHLAQGDITFPDPLFHSREVTLRASRNALAADFDRIIAALQAYEFNLATWITHRATLETAADAFPQWSGANSLMIKGLISI